MYYCLRESFKTVEYFEEEDGFRWFKRAVDVFKEVGEMGGKVWEEVGGVLEAMEVGVRRVFDWRVGLEVRKVGEVDYGSMERIKEVFEECWEVGRWVEGLGAGQRGRGPVRKLKEVRKTY